MLLRFGYLLLATILYSQFDYTHAQSSETTTTGPASTHTVTVGKADHKFEPDVIHAKVGDTVLFLFYPTNHSVVQAEFNGSNPCVPIEKTTPGAQGFFSGFRETDEILLVPPSWTLRVNDTKPVFFYCSAPESCKFHKMIGVINPNATQTLATQKQKASNVKFQLSPGEPWPDEAGPSPSTIVATRPSLESESTPIPSPSPHAHSTFPPGAIAGTVVGVTLIIALTAASAYFVGRHVKARRAAAAALPSDVTTGQAHTSPMQYVHGPGGMVYVPVHYADYNRMSIGVDPRNYPGEAPSPLDPRWSVVSAREIRVDGRSLGSSSPPVELYVPKRGDD